MVVGPPGHRGAGDLGVFVFRELLKRGHGLLRSGSHHGEGDDRLAGDPSPENGLFLSRCRDEIRWPYGPRVGPRVLEEEGPQALKRTSAIDLSDTTGGNLRESVPGRADPGPPQ